MRPQVATTKAEASSATAGAETLFDDVLTQSGAINVAAEQGVKGFPVISSENVAAWKPDWIVTGAESDKLEETRRRLLAYPVVAATRAALAGVAMPAKCAWPA